VIGGVASLDGDMGRTQVDTMLAIAT